MENPSPATIKMQAARLLIEEKRYETARELLKGLTNRQATDWMLKLDSITPKPRSSRWSWAWAFAVILALVCGILIVTLAIRERDANTRIWQAQKFDSTLVLTLYCEGNDYTRMTSCQEWAQNTVNANPSLTDVIVACEGDFFSLLALDLVLKVRGEWRSILALLGAE